MKSLIEIKINNSFNKGTISEGENVPDKNTSLNFQNQSHIVNTMSASAGSFTAPNISNNPTFNSLIPKSHNWIRDILIAVASIVIGAFITHFIGL